jgi:carbon monoxide dehydrogenase subunit G
MTFAGELRFPAPPEVVWSALEDFGQYERWLGWLGRLRIEGNGLHQGSVLEGTVSPPLPYRMTVRVELDRCVRARRVDAIVHGDLEGAAHLWLEPEGAGTRAEVSWTIEMMQWPMRAAARVAHPLLCWGHDQVVDASVVGFRARLRDLQERSDS